MKKEHGVLLSITGLMFMILYFVLIAMKEFGGMNINNFVFFGIVLISVGIIYYFGYKKRMSKFLGYRR